MNKNTFDHLMSTGWTKDRKTNLPDEYEKYKLPTKVQETLQNLYGLTLKSSTGNKRIFKLETNQLPYFDEIIDEFKDDLQLDIEFYPLGEMSEYGGYLMLDKEARFYFADSHLIYYGQNIFDLVDIVVLNKKSGIVIDFPGSCLDRYPEGSQSYIEEGYRLTYYCSNDLPTEWVFDSELGLVKRK